jgi:hypothetical protein
MIIKGIAKGDKDLRHFTFDDNDVVVRGGVYYYNVNYGKNPLEGEYGDEESGYVECSKVIPLGGKKPKPIPGKSEAAETPVQKVHMVQTPEPETKKRGRKPKVEKEEPSSEVRTDVYVPSRYEYTVTEINASNITELQNQLNENGLNGWELCGFDTNKTLFGSIHIVAIFKRKRG